MRKHKDVSECDTVVAFGIDGVVTKERVRYVYKSLERCDSAYVGLITTQIPLFTNFLVDEWDLSPNFVEAGYFRTYALASYKLEYSDKELIYVGSTILENLAAELTGWRYVWRNKAEQRLLQEANFYNA